MVVQEGAPPLAWRPTPLHHVFGDAGLSDGKAELEQFAVNARRSPERVLDAHSPDQRAQVRFDLRAPSPSPGFPPPVAAKARPMPTHERRGTDNRENRQD